MEPQQRAIPNDLQPSKASGGFSDPLPIDHCLSRLLESFQVRHGPGIWPLGILGSQVHEWVCTFLVAAMVSIIPGAEDAFAAVGESSHFPLGI